MSLEIEPAVAMVWIGVQMASHGLTLTDLEAAGCFAEKAPPAGPEATRTYRNAEGQKWDG
ncbi:H-NS histone family protein [Cupriavidus basilensis]|uniref:H-NS histone family protein n=1 Tax=Cupriavidus basilensis TaxID=68895 RepID=UPI003D335213